MGKDRQEKKLKQSRRTESDRDQSLSYPGSTMLEGPEESRKRNQ
ncbi:YpzI family protein [Peribacillus tepidiphilus]|nr:YpzI family protein [Peribacillus tepidiphilus]